MIKIKSIDEFSYLILNIGYETCFQLILNNIVQFIKEEKSEMPTLLTREEAIVLFKKHVPISADNEANQIINFFIAAEMLKVKEEEEISMDISLTTITKQLIVCDFNHIVERLNMAGFEVKKK